MEKSEIGNKIRILREGKDLSQNALANLAGISPTYVYQLEKGEKCPTVEYLEYICFALGTTLSRFFADDEQPTGVDEQEKLLLMRYRNASDKKRRAVIDLLSD